MVGSFTRLVCMVLAVLGRAIWFGVVLVGPESWTTRGGGEGGRPISSRQRIRTHPPQAGQGELQAVPSRLRERWAMGAIFAHPIHACKAWESPCLLELRQPSTFLTTTTATKRG